MVMTDFSSTDRANGTHAPVQLSRRGRPPLGVCGPTPSFDHNFGPSRFECQTEDATLQWVTIVVTRVTRLDMTTEARIWSAERWK